jgi:transposase
MHGFSLGYEDESGISEKPAVRITWAVKGRTPTIASSGSWKSLTMAGLLLFTPKGNNPRIYFRLQPGAMDKYDFLDMLKDVKIELKGRKLLLIWDGLPAHRAKEVREYIESQRSWLRVERYPAYAPELSPVEFIWSPMKANDLGNVPPKGFKHLKRMVRKSFKRIRADKTLLKSCLRKAGVLT